MTMATFYWLAVRFTHISMHFNAPIGIFPSTLFQARRRSFSDNNTSMRASHESLQEMPALVLLRLQFHVYSKSATKPQHLPFQSSSQLFFPKATAHFDNKAAAVHPMDVNRVRCSNRNELEIRGYVLV